MDKPINFGWKEFNKPTPAYISRRINVWSAIFGVAGTAVNSAPFLDATQASAISWFICLGVAILQAIRPFYSVETTQKYVPIENVDAMEVKEDNTK